MVSSIRNRLTALKNRSECIRASDVNTLYRDVVKQGAHSIRLSLLPICGIPTPCSATDFLSFIPDTAPGIQ